MKKTAILLLAALLITAIPIASTLATKNGQPLENRQTSPIHNALQKQDREQLRDGECLKVSPSDSGAKMIQERTQLRSQERDMTCSNGSACNSEYQSYMFQLREMLQLRSQNCFGYGK